MNRLFFLLTVNILKSKGKKSTIAQQISKMERKRLYNFQETVYFGQCRYIIELQHSQMARFTIEALKIEITFLI